MAPMTQIPLRSIVKTQVQMFDAERAKERAAEEAEARVQKQRQADEREAEVRRDSELGSQLRSTPIDANGANESSNAPSPPAPRRRKPPVAEIDSKAVPSSAALHTNEDLYSTSDIPPTAARILALETQLSTQHARIETLEAAREDLTAQVAALTSRRDEAERALLAATLAGSEASKGHRQMVDELRAELEAVREGRRRAEAEIEVLRGTVGGLRRELERERERREAEAEAEAEVVRDDVLALPVVAAPSAGVSSRRGSGGESERRRRGHRRSGSSGLSISGGFKVQWGEDKKEKKKKGGHK